VLRAGWDFLVARKAPADGPEKTQEVALLVLCDPVVVFIARMPCVRPLMPSFMLAIRINIMA
jgi:hypothetical protein